MTSDEPHVLAWRVGALDRRCDSLEEAVNALERTVEQNTRTMEIAREVARSESQKFAARRRDRFSLSEIVVGSAVAGCAVGGLILEILQALARSHG